MPKERNRRRAGRVLLRAARSALVAVVAIGIVGGAVLASAHETQSTASAICQSGEVCFWPTQGSYNSYYGGDTNAAHATYSGTDWGYQGYYPPLYVVTLDQSATVYYNRGNSCDVWLWDWMGWTGWSVKINRGDLINPLPSPYDNDTSSHHWCSAGGH